MTHPLQVYIEDSDRAALEAWARRRGWTKSQAVRVAIRALTRADTGGDPLLAASGMIDGLPPDLARAFDRYLEETFIAEAPHRYRRSRRPARAVRR
jgi:hypothetical protein